MKVLLFCFSFSAVNFLINFGIAVTFPLFIALGTVVGIPLNAGKMRIRICLSKPSEKCAQILFEITAQQVLL